MVFRHWGWSKGSPSGNLSRCFDPSLWTGAGTAPPRYASGSSACLRWGASPLASIIADLKHTPCSAWRLVYFTCLSFCRISSVSVECLVSPSRSLCTVPSSLPWSQPFLSFCLCRMGQKESFSYSAYCHQLRVLARLLDFSASDYLPRGILPLLLSLTSDQTFERGPTVWSPWSFLRSYPSEGVESTTTRLETGWEELSAQVLRTICLPNFRITQ